jgi:hypothetical protein
MTKFKPVYLPHYLRPVSLIIYVQTLDMASEAPAVLGGYALVGPAGLTQSDLDHHTEVTSHCQGCVLTLLRTIWRVRAFDREFNLFLPDGKALDMMRGVLEPRTPVLTRLVAETRKALSGKFPNPTLRYGRFSELCARMLDGTEPWT